jgi:hypothetical protein
MAAQRHLLVIAAMAAVIALALLSLGLEYGPQVLSTGKPFGSLRRRVSQAPLRRTR